MILIPFLLNLPIPFSSWRHACRFKLLTGIFPRFLKG